MSSRALKLEPFGAEAPEAEPEASAQGDPAAPVREASAEALASQLARARGEGRAAGFEEGVAHAEAQGQAELRILLAALKESFEDAVHARMEQERAAQGAAMRLAEALLTGVAPELARTGLPAEVARAAAEAFRASGGGDAVRIRVAPGQRDPVDKALRESGLDAPVEADSSLSEFAAGLDWHGGEDALDLEAALAAARAALVRHARASDDPQPSEEQPRSAAHG